MTTPLLVGQVWEERAGQRRRVVITWLWNGTVEVRNLENGRHSVSSATRFQERFTYLRPPKEPAR